MKRKLRLAFEQLEKEMEVIPVMEMNRYKGGDGGDPVLPSSLYPFGVNWVVMEEIFVQCFLKLPHQS